MFELSCVGVPGEQEVNGAIKIRARCYGQVSARAGCRAPQRVAARGIRHAEPKFRRSPGRLAGSRSSRYREWRSWIGVAHLPW